VIESIKKFFHEKHNKHVLEKLLKYVKITYQKIKQGKFSAQSFVVTGSIE
jgi:NAD-dependent DNA ligase